MGSQTTNLAEAPAGWRLTPFELLCMDSFPDLPHACIPTPDLSVTLHLKMGTWSGAEPHRQRGREDPPVHLQNIYQFQAPRVGIQTVNMLIFHAYLALWGGNWLSSSYLLVLSLFACLLVGGTLHYPKIHWSCNIVGSGILHHHYISEKTYRISILPLPLTAVKKSYIPLFWKQTQASSISIWLKRVSEINEIEHLVTTEMGLHDKFLDLFAISSSLHNKDSNMIHSDKKNLKLDVIVYLQPPLL